MPVFLGQMKAHVELQKRNREYGEIALQFRRYNELYFMEINCIYNGQVRHYL